MEAGAFVSFDHNSLTFCLQEQGAWDRVMLETAHLINQADGGAQAVQDAHLAEAEAPDGVGVLQEAQVGAQRKIYFQVSN